MGDRCEWYFAEGGCSDQAICEKTCEDGNRCAQGNYDAECMAISTCDSDSWADHSCSTDHECGCGNYCSDRYCIQVCSSDYSYFHRRRRGCPSGFREVGMGCCQEATYGAASIE